MSTLFGGESALVSALDTLNESKLDGLVKTSFTRNGAASVGHIVTRKGIPYMAHADIGIDGGERIIGDFRRRHGRGAVKG